MPKFLDKPQWYDSKGDLVSPIPVNGGPFGEGLGYMTLTLNDLSPTPFAVDPVMNGNTKSMWAPEQNGEDGTILFGQGGFYAPTWGTIYINQTALSAQADNSFFAPTESGDGVSDFNGRQILMSNGYGQAPTWETPKRYLRLLRIYSTTPQMIPELDLYIYFFANNQNRSPSSGAPDDIVSFLADSSSGRLLAFGRIRKNNVVYPVVSATYSNSSSTKALFVLYYSGDNSMNPTTEQLNNSVSYAFQTFGVCTTIPN